MILNPKILRKYIGSDLNLLGRFSSLHNNIYIMADPTHAVVAHNLDLIMFFLRHYTYTMNKTRWWAIPFEAV